MFSTVLLRLRFRSGLDEGDPAEAMVGTGLSGVVHRDGEEVLAGCQRAGEGEAVDDAVVVGLLWDCGGEKVCVGIRGEVLSQDFLAVQIDDEGVVALAAEFEAGVGFVGGEAVAEPGAVAVVPVFGGPDIQSGKIAAIAETSSGIGAVLPGLPCGIIEARGTERGVKIGILAGGLDAVGGREPLSL